MVSIDSVKISKKTIIRLIFIFKLNSDHDDDDTANSIELQLTLWNDQKKQGLGRDLDQTYYMCEVTYEKAVDGKLVPVQYSARFPEDDNKFVRVQRKHIFGAKLFKKTYFDNIFFFR